MALLVQEKAAGTDNRWLATACDDVAGIFGGVGAPWAWLFRRVAETAGLDSQGGVLVVEEPVVCCRPVTVCSAVLGLERRSSTVRFVPERVIQFLGPAVMAISTVLILITKFQYADDACGDGLVEGSCDWDTHDVDGGNLAV